MAGLLVGAFGVPWSITALGLLVATTALVLYEANERDNGEDTSGAFGAVGVAAGGVGGRELRRSLRRDRGGLRRPLVAGVCGKKEI